LSPRHKSRSLHCASLRSAPVRDDGINSDRHLAAVTIRQRCGKISRGSGTTRATRVMRSPWLKPFRDSRPARCGGRRHVPRPVDRLVALPRHPLRLAFAHRATAAAGGPLFLCRYQVLSCNVFNELFPPPPSPRCSPGPSRAARRQPNRKMNRRAPAARQPASPPARPWLLVEARDPCKGHQRRGGRPVRRGPGKRAPAAGQPARRCFEGRTDPACRYGGARPRPVGGGGGPWRWRTVSTADGSCRRPGKPVPTAAD